MPPRTQVNSATGIMGVTGSGKSSLIATLAYYVFRRWGKILRYYSASGGGFPAKIQEAQALGIIEVFRMRTRDTGDLSFETCYRAAQGWWPRRIHPASGEVPPGVEMVPPVSLRFEMRCPTGHLIKTVPAESLLLPSLCPQCRKMVTKLEMQVTKTLSPNKGFDHVGAVAFDDLTSMLSWEMMELGRRAGQMELKGEEGAIGGKVTSGDLKFGGTTRSHVGFAQTRGEELVHLALGIPNLVVPPVFTMLTHEDVDERSLSITGPKIAGRAKTDEAPAWFGNLLEAAKVPAATGAGEQRVLYLAEFTDATGRRHLCKNRAAPGTLPTILLDPADTDKPEHAHLAFTQFNLGLFFEMLDAALDRGIESAKAQYPNAPGMVEGWVDIGDSAIVVPQGVNVQEGGGVGAIAQGPATLQAPGGAEAVGVAAAPPAPLPAQASAPRTPRKRATAAGAGKPPEASPALPALPTPAMVGHGIAGPTPLPDASPSSTIPAPPGASQPAEAPVAQPVPPVQAAPQPAMPAVPPAPAQPVPVQPAPPAPPQAPVARPRPTAAPPPGRRPSAPAPRIGVSAVPAGSTPPAPGTPAGAAVSGPAAPAPRPPAAAPRPPAAAPRAAKPS